MQKGEEEEKSASEDDSSDALDFLINIYMGSKISIV